MRWETCYIMIQNLKFLWCSIQQVTDSLNSYGITSSVFWAGNRFKPTGFEQKS